MDFIRFNYASLILLLTIFQGGLYSLFLLTSRSHAHISGRLLGFFSLNFTLHFANILLSEFGPLDEGSRFNPVFALCYGPLLLLFVRSLVRRGSTMHGSAKHFALPLLALAAVAADLPHTSKILSILAIVQLTIYLLSARYELNGFRKNLRDQYSDIDEINLDWLSTLLNQMLLILGIAVVHFVAQSMELERVQTALTLLIFLTVLYFINTLVLKGMRHPSIDVWLDSVAARRIADDPPGSKVSRLAPDRNDRANNSMTLKGPLEAENEGSSDERYRGSGLSYAESREHFARLTELMENDEPFLDENLNIHQLAELMGISSKHLSQVINQNSDQNFYDFINRHRIEKAKVLLAAPDHEGLNVSEVMNEVGYKAKSTFNSLFKRYTGMTPSEFRREKGPNA